MNSLKWDKRLETGIATIDNQHKEIFNRIDKLGLALLEGKERAELLSLIRFLEKYIIEHFDSEEKLLFETRYPAYSDHCKEHRKFSDMYRGLLLEYQNKGADVYLALETEKKLLEWWEHHILKSDMFFIPYLKKENLNFD